jgi:type II secretory pathway component GspD/PulD (secretin)
MSPRTILTALFATALTLPVMAQSETQPATPPAEAAAPVATVQGAEPVAAPVSRDKDTLSVDFPDEDIKTILRNVADLFELNLVVPDTLTGKTSIKLRDVTWRQIFTVVLAPVGYSYIEEGNIIKIVSNELLQMEPPSTEVFILNNAKAADIKPTIDGLIDAATGGKIVIDARSNALVITERQSRMGRIRTIIEQLDKATDQVMIESKFVEVTDRDIRNIGVNWASLQGMQFGVGNIGQTWTRNRDQTFSSGNGGTSSNTTGGNTSSGNSVSYDVNPTSVNGASTSGVFGGPASINLANGQVTGVPSSLPANTSLTGFTPFVAGTPGTAAIPPGQTSTGEPIPGVAGTAGTPDTPAAFQPLSTVSSNNTATTSFSSAVNALNSLVNGGGTSRVATAVFSASDFNVIISALKTQSNTKVMSNPTVVTLNNTEAMLNIGQEFPVPSYNYNSERGTFEVSGFTYKPIGIILKVTPQVNARGVIKLNLEPEVSQQSDSTSFGGAGGALIPIISTRKVKTQVSLKDGYTMGIGGLITDAKSDGGNKVPVLGSIPVLGRLFSNKSVNNTATNLLIFITAKTVSADGAAPEEVFDPRAIKATGMTREDMPGFRAPAGVETFATPKAPAGK